MLVDKISFPTTVQPVGLVEKQGKTPIIGSTETFDSIFDAYMNMVSETNQLQSASSQAQLDFASGKTDDILSVVLAASKASTSLNFTVQVTSKILDSYREIMRMAI